MSALPAGRQASKLRINNDYKYARKREKHLKSGCGKKFLKTLI